MDNIYKASKEYNMKIKGELNINILWSPYRIVQTIIFLPCNFYLLSYGHPM